MIFNVGLIPGCVVLTFKLCHFSMELEQCFQKVHDFCFES